MRPILLKPNPNRPLAYKLLPQFENSVFSSLVIKYCSKTSGKIIDIGALEGYESITAMKVLNPNRFLLIEPNELSAKVIRLNFEVNNIIGYTLMELALYDGVTECNLMIPKEKLFSSETKLREANSKLSEDDYKNYDIIPINTQRLDDLLEREISVDAIKIDVGGLELKILQNSINIVRSNLPIIVIKVHQNTLELTYSVLTNLKLSDIGYKLFYTGINGTQCIAGYPDYKLVLEKFYAILIPKRFL